MNPYTQPMPSLAYLNWFADPHLPNDPGGELTPERIDVLRTIASARGHGAMLNALEEIESLRAERTRTAIEVGLLQRLAAEKPWSGIWLGGGWPPGWLVELVEQGRAAAIQADRAKVLAADNLGHVPPVPSPGRRWWTHAESPRENDGDTYEAAKRVLAAANGL